MRRNNSYAVELIPIRLLISMIIITAVIVLVAIASDGLRSRLAEHHVEQQCLILESSLSTMVGSGVPRDVVEVNAAEGTMRIHTFTLPDSLVYLSFGGDPDPMNTGILQPSLTEDGAAIFYKVEGGSKKVVWLPKETCKFREGTFVDNRWMINGSGHSYILQTGGTITLVFERVQQNNLFYILIHGNDEIE
jgi:hypothetical protein